MLVLFLVALGFPVFVVLAWAVDLTPEGLERTAPADAETDQEALPPPAVPSPGLPRRGPRFALGVLVVGAAIVGGTLYLIGAIMMAINFWQTIRGPGDADEREPSTAAAAA